MGVLAGGSDLIGSLNGVPRSSFTFVVAAASTSEMFTERRLPS